jgi:hypothetical protein
MSAAVLATTAECVQVLSPFTDRDWREIGAPDLDWSVWDTMIHVNDDLYFYAAQVASADVKDYVCFEVRADEHANPTRLLDALVIHGRLLAAIAASADPHSRAHHVFGAADPAGFAAMGIVETLVHSYDAVLGLDPGSQWRPTDELASPVLHRLFPDRPTEVDASAGDILLYLCGRISLGDRPRLDEWRWHGEPSTSPP